MSTVDAVVSACREYPPNHPIVSRIADILSPELIESGGPLRVADVLPLIGQMRTALSMERSRRMKPS